MAGLDRESTHDVHVRNVSRIRALLALGEQCQAM